MIEETMAECNHRTITPFSFLKRCGTILQLEAAPKHFPLKAGCMLIAFNNSYHTTEELFGVGASAGLRWFVGRTKKENQTACQRR